MRGVDLNVFQFDYDLTWFAFFLDADQRVYGRYGGRGAGEADEHLSLPGLKHAMRAALERYRRGDKPPAPPDEPPRTVEMFAAAKRLKPDACIHCHQAWDFRREEMQREQQWTRDEIWVYPLPENVGLELADDRGDVVKVVRPDSPAARAGLRAEDVLRRVNGRPVASYADVQFALHWAPKQGQVAVTWERSGREQSGTLDLPAGWRETDISWRESMWGLSPVASLHGQDLSAAQKRALGLPADRMAFRQGKFVPVPARAACVREGDVILGFEGRDWTTTMRQFNAFVRLNYNVGDRVTLLILRDGQRFRLPMTLAARPY
jgi:hypothetical protein